MLPRASSLAANDASIGHLLSLDFVVVVAFSGIATLPEYVREVGRMKIGLKDPCHCGSGRKYKTCCLP
ncbi:SEC-C metal-binding domain-containing protein [Roseateles flavus]|uniref:SEC-C metal-binding domain-containing protein n=1 Tax=Roseateles flavus TaxID=3149041 RepID=UPI003D32E8FE